MTTFALQRDRRQAAPDDFPQQLAELLGLLRGRPAAPTIRSRRLAATLPGRPELPDPWLLGSREQSAIWAGELGLPYAFADFINPGGAQIAARTASGSRRRAIARLRAPRWPCGLVAADRGGGRSSWRRAAG